MELLVIGSAQYGNGIAEELDEIVSTRARQVMRRVPLRLLEEAYEHITLGGSHASVCAILGIDPNLADWNWNLALEEALWERGHLQRDEVRAFDYSRAVYAGVIG